MASWANPTVAKLAVGEAKAGDLCGLVVVCSWPMPKEVVDKYEEFSKQLKEVMPSEAYVYPASTLHCTVITLRAFTAGPLDEEAKKRLREGFAPILAAARASEAWPAFPFKIRMRAP